MDVRLPDGTVVTNVPEGITQAELLGRLQAGGYDVSWATPPKGETGLIPAARAGYERLKGEAALLGGKLGVTTPQEAETYQKAQEEKAQRIFTPTEEGWTQAPLTKFKELLGGSLPYMAAPIAAGAAVAATPLTGTAALAAGIGAAGLTSAAQFTGSNLARQMETGKSLDEASLGAAAAASIPQAALDVVAFRATPVIRKLFASVGKEITEDAAQNLAKQGFSNTVKDYALTTGRTAGTEGLTEAGQAFFERLQAGLNISDDAARAEYLDNFIGGAVLGGALAPVGRYVERQKQVEEPLAPGQRPGESLEQTANRLNVEVQGLTEQLKPPPPSPFLSSEQLASMAAEPDGYAKLIQYEESIKDLPRSPEKVASRRAARELRARLEIETQQRQTPTDKPYPYDPFAPEPFQFKSSTELVDLINKIEDPADKLVRLLEYRAEVKNQPASAEREQALKDAGALYNEINKFAQAQGFATPAPVFLFGKDLIAAGISRKDPLYGQLRGKDLNKPDDVDAIVQATEAAQRRPDIKPELFKRLEELLNRVEAHIRDKPGSGFYGQRTYPKPSGAGVPVAGEPKPAVPTGGAEPSGRMGMVGSTAAPAPTVPREAAPSAPVDEFLRAKPREEFGKAVGASYGSQLRARRDNPNLKAAVKGENLGGVLNALTRSKSPIVAEVAQRGAPAGTTVKIDDDAVEKYVGRSFLDDRFIIAEAKNLLALRDAIKNKTSFIETVVVDEEGNTKTVERLANDPVILRADPYWMASLWQKNVDEFTLPQLEQALDNKIEELGEDQLKLTATASAVRTGIAGGAYDPATKTIRLAEYYAKDEGVVTHELVHAQVVEAVANPTKKQRPYVERLNKLYEHVKANAKERDLDFYGVSSIQEFIAEGMSNPRFQFFLNTIPYEKQSAWTKFVQTIADLLGIKNNTAFLELLTVYDRVAQPVKPETKVARTPSQEEALAETFPPVSETAFEPGLEIGEPEPDPKLLADIKKLEAEREKAQKTKVLPKGQIYSLLSAVRGKLTISDTIDVSPDKNMRVLTAKSNGTFISELVNDGALDKWLPPDMRPDGGSYDVQESEEYIKELLRNREHAPYAVKEKLDQLNLQIRNLDDAIEQEKQLDILIRQANAELQAASEERRAEETELIAPEGEAGDTVRAEGVAARKSLAKVAPQVSEKKFQELERRAKAPAKPAPAKEESAEVKAIKEERAQKIGELQGILQKILSKYGLTDVKLNLEEGMQDQGSYNGQLIKLALDLDNPVQTLRHEAIHALKELGFFTPAQWKVLTDRAKNEWIDKYLKNQMAVVDGKEVTRYDAYMDLYKGDQDKIIEEAIADAFGDFVKTKAPPGMMQAILTRMKNLFKAIKETLNQGGYETAEDVFGKIEEGKLTKAEKLVEQVEAGAKPSLRAPITATFKRWFGDSKVVDADGNPLVMYHGTTKSQEGQAFTRFDTYGAEYGLFGIGSYFTDDPELASSYAKKGRGETPTVYPVYLSIKNPIDMDAKADAQAWIDEFQEYDIEQYHEGGNTNESWYRAAEDALKDQEFPKWEGAEIMQDKLRSMGFDGVTHLGGGRIAADGKRHRVFIAFEPEQIKSATGNIGTFEPTSPDIRKSLRAPDTKEFKQFFRESKVVDDKGEPLVVYHGTKTDLTEFDTDASELRGTLTETDLLSPLGSHFARDAQVANNFATKSGAVVYPVYLSIQNPKVYKKEQDLRDELIKQNVDSQDINDILENPDNYLDYAEGVLYQEETFESRVNRYDADPKYRETVNQAAYNYLRDTAEPEAVVDFIKQLTNSWKEQNPTVDGIIYENGAANEVRGAKTATSYIAFNPGQIKSAIGNIGTFEGTEADIRKSLRTRWSEDRVNSLLNKYAYTTDDNATQAYAAFIRPEDFLNATSSKEYRQILETERTPLDVERLAAYDQEIYLEIAQTDEEGVYEIKGHEGRHRMMALRDAGVPSVPVVLVGRPYGRIKNAQVVEEAYLKPQAFEKRRAPRGIFLWEMIPINYAEAKNLKETFGGPADIKFSLRPLPTMPTDVTDRVKQTVIFRDRPGLVDRLLDAISPRRFSQFRKEFVNRYDALASLDRQAAEQIRLMGGVQQLADAKAESAALFSDLGGGLAASAMGVHDRVGGIPVYVRKYIVEKDFKKVGPDYTTKAAAEAAARRVPGAQVFEQGYTQISNANGVKGLIAIFSDLAKYAKPDPNEPSVFDQYQFWADVKRASKYIINPQTGKYEEKLFTKDDIRRAAQIEKAFPEFVQIQKEWIKYNDGLVDFMRDTGVISEAGAKEMKKHGDYFPFYRHLGEDDIQGPRLFSSIANVKTLKKAQGSEAAVTDFFETIVRNTQSAIQAGIKNVAARRATDQAMRIKEVFKLPRADSGPSVYRVLEDGKEVYYRAQDPLFIEALKSLNQPDLPFIGLLAGPAKLLRTLVTKDPAFQLANMMRDSLSAYVSSGFKFTPIVATIKQYAATIAGKSPEFVALRNAGVIGGYDYSRGVETSAKKLEDDMRKAAKARTGMEKLASPVTSLWGALEKSSEASDAATRQEVYKRVLAETGNEAEALYQALEVMNFNRKGRSPIIRILTAAVPFMNARIQGLDVLYRSGMRPIWGADATEQEKARLKTFWVRGMTMMALSSMYWMLTSDDDDYKKQEQETRDNYWLIPSLGIKIPIPFEIGVMFKVIPERVLEYAFGDDTGKDFMKSMSRHFLSTFGFNPIPQAILPAIEITANYSFFTQRPIITQGMENISPEYQVGPNTSKVAGAVGQTLGISPIKLDHLIQGYTGTMGMYAVNLFDTIFSMNDEAPKASRRLEQMPVLRRFMVDPEARGQITAYYDFKNSVDEVVRTSNYLERSMDFEQYGKYMQENIKMFAAREYINDLEKTMKDFREMKNLIRISKMDADDKRDSLTNIGKMEQQLTQNIRTLKKQVAEQ